jgi:DNA-binding NarL/FixJ family response regulator
MKLLIADDSYEIRSVLRSICHNMFDVIIECADGEKAIDLFNSALPDWVLMDIQMGRLDGISATKNIKKNHPGAKVIIVSQFSDAAFIETSKNAGAFAFVPKEDLTKIETIIRNYHS